MTRKKFIKTLYSCGYTRREAAHIVSLIREKKIPYWNFGVCNAVIFMRRNDQFYSGQVYSSARKKHDESEFHTPHMILEWAVCGANKIGSEVEWRTVDVIRSERGFDPYV